MSLLEDDKFKVIELIRYYLEVRYPNSESPGGTVEILAGGLKKVSLTPDDCLSALSALKKRGEIEDYVGGVDWSRDMYRGSEDEKIGEEPTFAIVTAVDGSFETLLKERDRVGDVSFDQDSGSFYFGNQSLKPQYGKKPFFILKELWENKRVVNKSGKVIDEGSPTNVTTFFNEQRWSESETERSEVIKRVVRNANKKFISWPIRISGGRTMLMVVTK